MAITSIYGGKVHHKRLIIPSSGHTLSHTTRGFDRSMSGTLRPWQGVQKRIVAGERIHKDRLKYIRPATCFSLDDLGPISIKRDPWLQRIHRAYL